MKRMKGISPLIAVIMLIAFVLVVSGIFYSWLFQFAYSHREEFRICSRAKISLQSAYYNPDTGNISVAIFNSGDVPLEGFIILISPKGAEGPTVKRDFLKKMILAKDIGVFPVVYEEDLKSMRIQSVECAGVQEIIDINDVEGL